MNITNPPFGNMFADNAASRPYWSHRLAKLEYEPGPGSSDAAVLLHDVSRIEKSDRILAVIYLPFKGECSPSAYDPRIVEMLLRVCDTALVAPFERSPDLRAHYAAQQRLAADLASRQDGSDGLLLTDRMVLAFVAPGYLFTWLGVAVHTNDSAAVWQWGAGHHKRVVRPLLPLARNDSVAWLDQYQKLAGNFAHA